MGADGVGHSRRNWTLWTRYSDGRLPKLRTTKNFWYLIRQESRKSQKNQGTTQIHNQVDGLSC